MKYIIGALLTILWLYLLRTMDRAKLPFWHFLTGSAGLFLLMMVLVRPVMMRPMARTVAALAGLFGNLTGTFSPFFKYSTMFVQTVEGAITLQIDFECSGIIEIMAFLSLLVFFRVYTPAERLIAGLLGTIYITLANVLRVTLICESIHFFGPKAYYIAHSLVGRVVFYVLSILLYFYVFTKPQIARMRIRMISYEHS